MATGVYTGPRSEAAGRANRIDRRRRLATSTRQRLRCTCRSPTTTRTTILQDYSDHNYHFRHRTYLQTVAIVVALW